MAPPEDAGIAALVTVGLGVGVSSSSVDSRASVAYTHTQQTITRGKKP